MAPSSHTHSEHIQSSLLRRHTNNETWEALESTCHIPRPKTPNLECCCGRPECAYLKHNRTALEGVEKDVQTAAQLGQALLIRHEAYMADAEQERLKMSADIDRLEADKQRLEAENARTTEENKDLLSQLEDLNSTVADSDSHIKSLNATLLSTQKELQRLTALALRTEQLESQLASLEQDQVRLQQSLVEKQEDERSAIHRWRKAEQTLAEIEDQIERIEKESREERERHAEVVGRMERRIAVEKELEGAAGRLKGAAAVTMGKQGNGTNVISHFVKDILQDNANLQLGIVELREMLNCSNEEVQSLREHVLNHQPIMLGKVEGGETPTLGMELAKSSQEKSPSLHVHHHYHAPRKVVENPAKDKASIHRRPRKRRTVTTPGIFSSTSSGSQTPQTPRSRSIEPQFLSTPSTIISHTSLSIPSPTPRPYNRFSTHSHSSIAPSSVPSSPQSIYQMSSIFDRSYNHTPLDSSRPTSPESNAPVSPSRRMTRESRYYNRDLFNPTALHPKAATPAPVFATLPSSNKGAQSPSTSNHELDPTRTGHATIPEEDESHLSQDDPADSIPESSLNSGAHNRNKIYQPLIRRATSHESLLSISGMDIHTLHHRPSQLLSTAKGFSPTTPLSISSSSSPLISSKAVLSATTATARPPLPRKGYDSSSYRHLLGKATTASSGVAADKGKETLGKRVGGWVWGKWGVGPAVASERGLRAKKALTAAAAALEGRDTVARVGKREVEGREGTEGRDERMGRGDRIGGSGGVVISEVDEDLLRESLGG